MSVTVEVPGIGRPDAGTVRVTSPATGELLGEVPDLDAAGVAAAVARSRAAAPSWAAASLETRIEALLKWRDLVLDTPLVPETLVRESGKPRHEAEGIEVLYLCELIRAMARLSRRALAEETRNPRLFLTKKTRLVQAPVRRRGRHRPLEFPDPEQCGRRRGAAPGRQHGRAQAFRGHPPHVVSCCATCGRTRGILRTSSRSSPGGGRRGPRSWTSWTPSCSPAPSRRAGRSPRAAASG